MKLDWSHLDPFRKLSPPLSSRPGDRYGAFWIKYGTIELTCIASMGDEQIPWEHVSVKAHSYKGGTRTPTWDEMCFVKSLFWDTGECVVQYHPRASEYVNNHPDVLHLWRPRNLPLPTPPVVAV